MLIIFFISIAYINLTFFIFSFKFTLNLQSINILYFKIQIQNVAHIVGLYIYVKICYKRDMYTLKFYYNKL